MAYDQDFSVFDDILKPNSDIETHLDSQLVSIKTHIKNFYDSNDNQKIATIEYRIKQNKKTETMIYRHIKNRVYGYNHDHLKKNSTFSRRCVKIRLIEILSIEVNPLHRNKGNGSDILSKFCQKMNKKYDGKCIIFTVAYVHKSNCQNDKDYQKNAKTIFDKTIKFFEKNDFFVDTNLKFSGHNDDAILDNVLMKACIYKNNIAEKIFSLKSFYTLNNKMMQYNIYKPNEV